MLFYASSISIGRVGILCIALFATQQLPEGKALSISHPFYPSNFDRFLDLLFKLSGIEFQVVRVIVSSNCSYPIFFRQFHLPRHSVKHTRWAHNGQLAELAIILLQQITKVRPYMYTVHDSRSCCYRERYK